MLLAAVIALAAPLSPPAAPDLAADLQGLVRLATPAQRQERARELARRKSVSIEDWLRAMGTFGSFDEVAQGTHLERVELPVGDEVEDTELHLHVPVDYDPAKPAPLLLAFHGTGGDGAYMARMWVEVAERLGMVVVAPSEAGPNEGYAFSERERLAALAALRWARLSFNVDEDRVFATGVSRGGHLAWDLALRYPGTLAGIAPMIGSPRVQPRQGQNNLRYLENVVDLPIRDLQGQRDDPGMIFNLKFAFERLEALGAKDAELFLQRGLGHSFRLGEVDWESFFTTARRNPLPSTVRRAVACPGEGRAFWVEVLETRRPVSESFEVPLTKRWREADAFEQRALIQEVADAKTGHLTVRLRGQGRYEAEADRGVESFRMLLPERSLRGTKSLEVLFNGKRLRPRPKPSAEVLLVEFAERFDRRFLPVAEVVVK